MAEQQPGPASTGVADVPKAVEATEAAKSAVVAEAHMVETFSKPRPRSADVAALACVVIASARVRRARETGS